MKFRKGEIVELSVRANAIPAGRYRFEEQMDEMLVLSVCNDIIVGLSKGFWGAFLKRADDKNPRATPVKQFIKKYSAAYEENKKEPQIPQASRLTFCVMSPRYGIFR